MAAISREVVLPIHGPRRLGGGRSPARDSALNGWFGGLARVCPTPDSGIPLGTELLLLEGSSHTSLPLTTRPPPYPETEGKAG